MAFIHEHQVGVRQIDRAPPHGAGMQCLDRADLDARARAWRKAGLDDAHVNDPDIKEFRYRLLYQLGPVGDEHHPFATRDGVSDDRIWQ